MTYQTQSAATPAVVTSSQGDVRYVEWGPIIAGAVAASAVSFVLLTFGVAVGFSLTSPWPTSGFSAAVVGIVIAIWTVLVQIAAFAGGGYLAGRMRVRWAEPGSEEARFRDAAHGFLVWALGVVIGAALLGSAVSGGLKTATDAAARVAGGATAGAASNPSLVQQVTTMPYEAALDVMLRPGGTAQRPAGQGAGAAPAGTEGSPGVANSAAPAATGATQRGDDAAFRSEAGRLLSSVIRNRELTAADRTYLAGQLSSRYGIPQAEAEKRVDTAVTSARDAEIKTREAADKARRAAVLAGFLAAASLLISCAAAVGAAAMGGRDQDNNSPLMFAGHRFW
jgi:hypothetical protein